MSTILTGKPQLNREVNRRILLDRIRQEGEVSRAELAKLTRIRPPTVSAVVRQLIDEGLVVETGAGETSGGRAPRMFSLQHQRPAAIGFEITETGIYAGLCGLAGRICDHAFLEYAPSPPGQTIERLVEVGEQLLSRNRSTWSDLQGVGVAVPGYLSNSNGVIRWSHPLNWRDVPLAKMCSDRLNLPIHVVNDSLAGGLAAQFLGAARGVRNLVYLHVRFLDASHGVVGLGSGVVIDGEPYHGEFGAAGEITLPVKHPLLEATDQDGKTFASIKDLVSAFTSKQESAVKAVERAAEEIAVLAVHAVNFLEPGMIIVGSDIDVLGDCVLDRIRQALDRFRLTHAPGETQVVGSTLGEMGVVQGSVVPILQRLYRMPRWS